MISSQQQPTPPQVGGSASSTAVTVAGDASAKIFLPTTKDQARLLIMVRLVFNGLFPGPCNLRERGLGLSPGKTAMCTNEVFSDGMR